MYLCRWATKTETNLDDEILKNVRAPIFLLGVLFGVYYGLSGIASLQAYVAEFTLAFTIAQILVSTFIITRIINILISWYAQDSVKHKRNVNNHILFILKRVLQAVVYVLALVIILGLFEQDLSGIFVGLGVGGIAIALALQNILSDAFSALTIYFDRPFEIGDFIVVGDHSGTVKKIGIRSTRIQLLQGEELVISNQELTTASVRNFKKLKKRRVSFDVKVTYETSGEKLEKIPKIIAEVIKETKMADLDRVHFREFGDFSLNFEVVYYIPSGDYTRYMDIQQQINYKIFAAFEKEEIEMAYPTQKIFYAKDNGAD
jgi:small-conductance mechanosensitive channel